MERSKFLFILGSAAFILGFGYLAVDTTIENIQNSQGNKTNPALAVPDMTNTPHPESCVNLQPGSTMFSTVDTLKNQFGLSQDQPITITIDTNWGPVTYSATTNNWINLGLEQRLPNMPDDKSIFQLAHAGESFACVKE